MVALISDMAKKALPVWTSHKYRKGVCEIKLGEVYHVVAVDTILLKLVIFTAFSDSGE